MNFIHFLSPLRFRERLIFYNLVFLLVAIAMSTFGRVIFCQCQELRLWISDVGSSHNSQHLFDPYSFSHLLHGVLFYFLLSAFGFPRQWALVIGFGLEAAWEILENSPLVIERYRQVTLAQGYSGDSIVNSLGDLLSCLAGLELARLLGGKWSILLFFAVELSMLALIKDCLTLNVLMLLYPLESIKHWQLVTVHRPMFIFFPSASLASSAVTFLKEGRI